MGYEARQYSGMIDDDTIIGLFERLVEKENGNISKVCQMCGIARKTYCDWKDGNQDIKMPTKEKILEQLLTRLTQDTLDKLMLKLADSQTDVLMGRLSHVYEQCFQTSSPAEIKGLLADFERVCMKYSGWIYNNLDPEIEEMMANLARHAKKSGISWEKPNVHLAPKNIKAVRSATGGMSNSDSPTR